MRKKLAFKLLLFVVIAFCLIVPALCQPIEESNVTSNNDAGKTNYYDLEHLSIYLTIAGLIYAYLSSRKSEIKLEEIKKPMRFLNDILNEEEIIKQKKQESEETKRKNESLKKEKSELLDQLKSLEISIKNMPNEAKKVFLEERVKEDERLLVQLYDSILSTQKQLNDVKANSLISEDIREMIEKQIKPKYYFENRINSLKDTLLMLTLCAGIFTSVLPYSLSRIVSTPFYIVSLAYLVKLIVTYLGNDDIIARTSFYRKAYQMPILFSGSLFVFVLIAFFDSTVYHNNSFYDILYTVRELFSLIFLLITVSLFISIIYYVKYRKLIQKPIPSFSFSLIYEPFEQIFRKNP